MRNWLLLLLAIALILSSCLDLDDRLELSPSGSLTWQIEASGPQELLEHRLDSFPRIAGLHLDTSWTRPTKQGGAAGFQLTAKDPSRLTSLDSSGWCGPWRQELRVGPDSLGRTELWRKLHLERDLPGDDGSYADRMLAATYRGVTWRYVIRMPGRVVLAEPKPQRVDSLGGIVSWDVPMVRLVQGSLEFRVLSEHSPVTVATADSLFVPAVLVFFLGIALFAVWRQYRKR